MKLLFDENMPFSFVEFLSGLGHDVKHVVTDYESSAADFDVLGVAIADGRVLVTNDRDFGGLVNVDDLRHSGIIYLRLHRLGGLLR